ncbi:MAG: ABC transporter substrate-binding protein [Kiritimatiellae bacterium]|nr:ABC transporter substrate-binding protein [Kiritimatiellia bacterium]
MKKTITRALALALFATAALGQESAKLATQAIMERTLNQGIAILKDSQTTDAQKLGLFDGLLEESCHTDLISMLALGKNGWAALDAGQRVEFTKAFFELMKRTYYGKLSQLDVTNVKVFYRDNIELGTAKRNIQTTMKNSGSGFSVDYKFALRNERWAIYDMEVEGISLLASYRSQFDDFLKTKSPAELIKSLESKDQSFTVDAFDK